MPTNMYGPNDNFDLETSHVLPAILRKITEAKYLNLSTVELWGTGNPLRVFLHVDDLADACFFLLKNYNEADLVNIGTYEEVSIKELAKIIKEVVGFKGTITWNTSKPDGTIRKIMDVSNLERLGWTSKIKLLQGISKTYEWYLKNEYKK